MSTKTVEKPQVVEKTSVISAKKAYKDIKISRDKAREIARFKKIDLIKKRLEDKVKAFKESLQADYGVDCNLIFTGEIGEMTMSTIREFPNPPKFDFENFRADYPNLYSKYSQDNGTKVVVLLK
jgi:hypothetical protein